MTVSLYPKNSTARTLILVVGVAIALLVRFELYIDDKSQISHDEAISLLTAFATEGEYRKQSAILSGQWVQAAKWKTFIETIRPATPAAVADNLTRYNIHPPLYFWALSAWIQTFGPDSARILNLPLVLMTVLALYALARRQLRDQDAAALVALLWILSPQVIRVSAEARQYELLTLTTVLLAWQAARIIDGDLRRRAFLIFGAAALLVMLTHYHGALVIIAALVTVVLYRREALLRCCLALAGAAAAFVFLHPGFWRSFVNHYADRNTLDVSDLPDRIVNVGSAFLGFYGWRSSWTTSAIGIAVIAVLATGIVAAAIYIVRRPRHGLILCLAAIPTAAVVLLYLTAMSPSHAMGAKYLAIAWPFIAFLHVVAIQRFAPRATLAITAGLVVFIGPAMLWLAMQRTESALPAVIRTADRIVLDNLSTGILPRYLKHARKDAAVFAQSQAKLIANIGEWSNLLKPGDILILNPSYTGSKEGQAELISRVRAIHGARIIFSEYTTTVLLITNGKPS